MATETLKRHPIRGFLYGILFGLGLMMIVVGQGWAALGTLPPVIVFLLGLVVGTVWGLYGPAKAPKGPPPAEQVDVIHESSRFDDFSDSATPDAPGRPLETPGVASDDPVATDADVDAVTDVDVDAGDVDVDDDERRDDD